MPLEQRNPRSLANLKLFQPGQSGNPSGRKQIPQDVKEMARGHTKEAIACLAAIMRSPKEPGSVRVRAAEVILDRAWGKPETSVEAKIDVDVEIGMKTMTDEERRAQARKAIMEAFAERPAIEGEFKVVAGRAESPIADAESVGCNVGDDQSPDAKPLKDNENNP